MIEKIAFDMDGTLGDLYADPQWLKKLRACDPTPYAIARPLVNMSQLARYIHKAQKAGYKVGIVSWLSKESNTEYDEKVTTAKKKWLAKHLPSVRFDFIEVVAYGTPKSTCISHPEKAILFDDEERNLTEWKGTAVHATKIIKTLQALLQG